MPDDFPERLEAVRNLFDLNCEEMVGVSWGEFAERVGVTERGMLKWRRGGPPSGAYLWSIIELARDVPGGYDLIMYGDDGTEE